MVQIAGSYMAFAAQKLREMLVGFTSVIYEWHLMEFLLGLGAGAYIYELIRILQQYHLLSCKQV